MVTLIWLYIEILRLLATCETMPRADTPADRSASSGPLLAGVRPDIPRQSSDFQRAGGSARYDSRSRIIAMPWPPPTHIVSRPNCLSWNCSELISVE